MHHRVPIRHHEWIRKSIRHCWPVYTGHHFPQASNHPHWVRSHGQIQVSQKRYVPIRLSHFFSRLVVSFLARQVSILHQQILHKQCYQSDSTLLRIVFHTRVSLPYRQVFTILQQPMKRRQFPMRQEYQHKIPINPERSHAPTEHIRRPHIEQVPGVYQIQG